MSAGEQNFRRQPDGLAEVAGDGSQGGQEKIAEAMAFEPRPFDETMLKQAGEQGLVFRERDDAVANVSRRKHVELLAEASAGAAVVADRDHGAEFADFRLAGRCQGAPAAGHVTLESLQQGREAGAAADGDDAQTG